MSDIFESILERALSPVYDQLQELSDENEDLRRRQQNTIRLGKVSKIDPDNKRIKVKHGELTTPFIKWLSMAAGQVKQYRCPTVGEMTILLNFGGGDNWSQSVALCGFDSESFPFPVTDPNLVVMQYGDKCSQTIDLKKGSVLWEAQGGMTLDTPRVHNTGDEQIDGKLRVKKAIKGDDDITDKYNSMDSMRDVYHGHDHNKSVSPPKKKMK